jgi:hypothetical protein
VSEETNHLTEIDAAIKARAAKLQEQVELATVHGRARRHWGISTRNAHPSRVPEIVAIISGGEDRIDQLVAAGNIEEALRAVDRVTAKLRNSGFSEARLAPLQSEIWAHDLKLLGYLPACAGVLFNTAGGIVRWPDSQIEQIDWWHIRIDGKIFTHEELLRRAGVRGRVPTRPEVEKQAETDPTIRAILRRIDEHQKRS